MYVRGKDIEIQPELEPGSSKFFVRCSYQLSHWSSDIGAEDSTMVTVQWYIVEPLLKDLQIRTPG